MADEPVSHKAEIETKESWNKKLQRWLPKGTDEAKIQEYATALAANDINSVETLARLEGRDLADLKIAVGHRPIILRKANELAAPSGDHGERGGASPTALTLVLGQLGIKYHLAPQLEELKSWDLWRGVFGEFFASGIFVFIVNSIIVSSGSLENLGGSLSLSSLSTARYLSIAVGAGFAFALANYAFFPSSGGHITPAITFGLLWSQQISPLRWILYLAAQVVGALVATGFVKIQQFEYFSQAEGGMNSVQPGYDDGSSVGIETLTTFILVITALSFYDQKRCSRDNWMGHLALGFVVLTVHLIALPINGASMNPARSFASSAVYRSWQSQWTWWLGPALGSLIAAVFYEVCLRERNSTDSKVRPL